jgi:hypothetical protein
MSFAPYAQPAFGTPYQYYQLAPQQQWLGSQQQWPAPRQQAVQQQPRKQAQPKPAEVATLPPLQEVTRHVEVPRPEQIGIRLDEPTVPAVVVPAPEKIGIRLD